MSTKTAAQAFADATSAIVDGRDILDIVHHLLRDCASLVDADAVGVMVTTGSGQMELLAATSHRVAELELFQAQHDHGPCLDAVRYGEQVAARSAEEIRTRWPQVGPTIVGSGYAAVYAFPMRWHGRVVGGLNVFKAGADDDEVTSLLLGQAFADVTTVVVVQSAEGSADDLNARVRKVVGARASIERAKGVLAYQHNVDLAEAYERLLNESRDNGPTLTDAAEEIVRRAHRPG